MVLTCCVIACRNNSDILKKWKQCHCLVCNAPRLSHRCQCASPYKMKPFPTTRGDKDAREKWKVLINRRDSSGRLWSPKKDSHVCSLHFLDGRPTPENPYPSLHLGYEGADKKVRRLLFGDQVNAPHPKRKKVYSVQTQPSDVGVDESIMPITLSTSISNTPDSTATDPPVDVLPSQPPPSPPPHFPKHWTQLTAFLLVLHCLWMLVFRYHTQARHLYHSVRSLTQLLTEEKKKVTKLTAQVEKLKAAARELSLSSKLLKTDKDVNFFTGIVSKQVFNELLSFISPYIHRQWRGTVSLLQTARKCIKKRGPRRQLSTSDEFLLTLMKIRLGLLNKDLESRFGVSTSLCSRIFFSWIRGMSSVLSAMVFMPDQEQLAASKPPRFHHPLHNRLYRGFYRDPQGPISSSSYME